MQKAPRLPSKDALRLKTNGLILPQSLTNSQSYRLSRLKNYIKRRQLTQALKLLEQRGITGDTALFILGCVSQSLNLQRKKGRAQA